MSTGFPDRPGSREPGIDQLIKALTAEGYPHELAGRDEALAAFRTARREPRRAGFPARLSRSARLGLSARLGAVAAALVAAIAGLTAAAYAKALPAPVQHIAYSVLAPFGVPDSQPSSPAPRTRPHSPPSPGSGRAAPGATSPAASSGCPCPTPSRTSRPALPGSVLTFTATRTQLPANGFAGFSGKLTDHGRPEPDVRLLLLEQVAGTASWQQAGSGVTGRHGGIRIGVRYLTQNATFRLTGPDGLSSPAIDVTVIPRVQLWRVPAQPGTDRLVAEARFGDAGDVVVLEERSAGAWHSVTSGELSTAHLVSFAVPAATAGGHYYQVVLQSTSTHGASVSNTVFEPRVHSAIGARAIESHPAPSPGTPRHGTHRHKAPRPVAPGPVSPSPSAPVIVISLTVQSADVPEVR